MDKPKLAKHFADFVRRRLQGESLELEDLIRAHPEHEDELRRWFEAWLDSGTLLQDADPAGSFAERLRAVAGTDIDPQVNLQPEEPDSFSDGFVERLSDRAPASTRYQLKGEVARGAMGAVLRVWDEDLRRYLAMKVILSRGNSAGETTELDRGLLARFLEEAQVTGQLDHPGIVPVHELGLDEGGRVFFTMKLVKGKNLAQVFDELQAGEGGWTQTQVLGLVAKVCEAMSYAHDKGVVHRDLKPANIMVGKFGEVYVMDWGLAKVMGREDARDMRLRDPVATAQVRSDRRDHSGQGVSPALYTMDGDLLGTPAYMAPEQAAGRNEEVGPAADVYAVGAMLYHLLGRQMPYVSPGARVDLPELVRRVRHEAPDPLQGLAQDAPQELIAICERAMARDPAARYADMPALGADLAAYLEGRVVRAYRVGAWAEAKKWVLRNRPLAAALGAGVLLLLLSLAISLGARHRLLEVNAQLSRSEDAALATQSRFLADLASQRVDAGDAGTGLLLALEALPKDLAEPERPLVQEARVALYGAVTALREQQVLGGFEARLTQVLYSPDGSRLLITSADGSARLVHEDGSVTVDLEGHTGLITAAAFHPSGSPILTASEDGSARLWGLDGEPQAVLSGHLEQVLDARFSPDGSQVITASGDGTARTWGLDGEPLLLLEGHTAAVNVASFSPDGRRLLTASADGTARLWDAEGQALSTLEGHGSLLFGAEFLAGGERIVTTYYGENTPGGDLMLWDGEGQPLTQLKGHQDLVTRLRVHPDGGSILSASDDGTARLWSREGELLAVLDEHEKGVTLADFSAGGQRIVTASFDGSARIWGADGTPMLRLAGHGSALWQAKFHPDGNSIVTLGSDKTVRTWTLDPLVVPSHRVHAEWLHHVALSPDGLGLVTASLDRTARRWTLEGQPCATFTGHGREVRTVQFHPTQDLILTASSDRTARIWSLGGQLRATLEGHTGAVNGAFYSPGGDRIVTLSSDRTARLWDPEGAPLAVLRGHSGILIEAAFSPDGTRLVTAGQDDRARLWNADGVLLQELPHTTWAEQVAFSPDGMRLVTGCANGTVRLWDRQGQPLGTLEGHTGRITHLVFSPSGDRLLTTSSDRTARLWGPDGELLATLEGHDGPLIHGAFGPEGELIATGSYDRTARLWDGRGALIGVLRGHEEILNQVLFTHRGAQLLTAAADGTLRRFPVLSSTAALQRRALELAPRELTAEQRQRFFLEATR